jgi:hypothetical protein
MLILIWNMIEFKRIIVESSLLDGEIIRENGRISFLFRKVYLKDSAEVALHKTCIMPKDSLAA